VTRVQKIALGKQNAEAKVAELRRRGVRLSASDRCAIYAQERLVALGKFEKSFEIVTGEDARSSRERRRDLPRRTDAGDRRDWSHRHLVVCFA